MTARFEWMTSIVRDELARQRASEAPYDSEEAVRAVAERVHELLQAGQISMGDIAAYRWSACRSPD
jgi:hypothetical protein